MSDRVIETSIFRCTPSQYTRGVLVARMSRYGFFLLLPLLAAAVGAFYRWEWIVVGLALLLLVYPFVLMNCYFRYSMREEALVFIRPMRVVVGSEGLALLLFRDEVRDGEVRHVAAGRYEIPFSDVRSAAVSPRCLTLRLLRPEYASLRIPDSAWTEIADKTAATDILQENGIKFA